MNDESHQPQNRPTMDQLAADFRERVAALWKCCATEHRNHVHDATCLHAFVPDCEWTVNSKRQWIWFSIGHDNGKWSYSFTKPHRTEGATGYLSMEELMTHRNLKHIRIGDINVEKPASVSMHSMHALRSRAEIKRLMNFVIFLSNEPDLNLSISNVQIFDSPEGAILLNSLSKMTFSRIWALYGISVYNQIVENQFLRRKPTTICCWKNILPNSEFFVEHLGNGNIKRFFGPSDFHFQAELMERLINRFLENPENCGKNNYYIEAKFEESTKEMLEKKLKEGRCEKVVRTHATEYRFKANNPKLKKNPCLRIKLSVSGLSSSISSLISC